MQFLLSQFGTAPSIQWYYTKKNQKRGSFKKYTLVQPTEFNGMKNGTKNKALFIGSLLCHSKDFKTI